MKKLFKIITFTILIYLASFTHSNVVHAAPGDGTQEFAAAYFNNTSLSGTPVLSRTESEINHTWELNSPGVPVNADNFSTRWTTTANFSAGTYQFTVTADDGVRLFIDDVLVLDKWIDQPPTTYQVTKTLSEGNHTIRMEYYERYVGATA
ncbi:hypothetical protein C4579_00190, partial [Candidatus Microgenomates bacterium]